MSAMNTALSMMLAQIEAVIPAMESAHSPLLLARLKRCHGQFSVLQSSERIERDEVLEAAHELGSTLAEMFATGGEARTCTHQVMSFWHGLSHSLSVETAQ